MFVVEDRVEETSTTTGTGDVTLAGAVAGFKAFSAVCATGDTFFYAIEAIDGNKIPTGDWETGLGTYSASNTLTRTAVLRSSNSNAAVSFAAGTKNVMLADVATFSDRAPVFPGNYWWPPDILPSSAGQALAVGTIICCPFVLRRPAIINEIAYQITTLHAANNFQIAIYAADPVTGWPTGAPLYSSPSQTTAATGVFTITGLTLQLLPNRIYWYMINSSTATAAIVPGDFTRVQGIIFGSAASSMTVNNAVLRGWAKAVAFGTWPTFTGVFATDGWGSTGTPRVPTPVFKSA